MAVTRKSRSDSNFKGLGQHCWLKAMRFFAPVAARLLKAHAIFQCYCEACEQNQKARRDAGLKV